MKRTEETNPNEKPSSASAKRPYNVPRLRRLGSVRDLTLGSSGNSAEPGFTKRTRGM